MEPVLDKRTKNRGLLAISVLILQLLRFIIYDIYLLVTYYGISYTIFMVEISSSLQCFMAELKWLSVSDLAL